MLGVMGNRASTVGVLNRGIAFLQSSSEENYRSERISWHHSRMVSRKSKSCDEGCEGFVGSHSEEFPDENRSKRSKLSGRETQKTVDDVKLRVEFSPELPGEMIEKIISLIPFPHILTARALSNEWRLRFCAQASNTEDVRFSEMVKFAGASWPVYFPLVLDVKNRVITGLDYMSWTWVTLCKGSLDFEAPPRSNPVPWEFAFRMTGLGSLLYISTNTRAIKDPEKEFFAYNVFTRAWKWLPPRPACEWLSKSEDSYPLPPVSDHPMYLIPDGPDSYKVLILANLHRVVVGESLLERRIGAYLYESRNNSWTVRLSSVGSWPSVFGMGAYWNGVIYLNPFWDDAGLLRYSAYNVESGCWDQHLPPLRLRRRMSRTHKFIVLENQMLMFSWAGWDDEISKNSFILYKVDPRTGYCDVIYRGPPEPIPEACARLLVWHGDSIFFETGNSLIEFNIRKHTWTHSPPIARRMPYRHLVWSSTTFEPGRNPFITV
ncbi:hypothetical protein R1sor_026723 [Riccia sorocarpa]|uniref:F-box domain-containing protein n=1 Tax=Riccia sorocarpa TaxID=122646 RepID=A0ABD3GFC4_9MARC